MNVEVVDLRFNLRPAEHTPFSRLEKALEVIAAAGVVSGVLLLALRWSALPAVIPMHFRLSGAPTATGGKHTLILLVAVNVVLYLLVTVLSRIPSLFNYPWPINAENARRQYQIGRTALTATKAELVWVLVWAERQLIHVGLGESERLSLTLLPIFILIQTATFAYFMYLAYKTR